MANGMKHKAQGTVLLQTEFEEEDTGHVFDSQATGDLGYASSATVLRRLGIGATDTVLHVVGGIPAWSATLAGLTLTTPTIVATGWANANHAHAAANSGGLLTTVGALDSGSLASGFGSIVATTIDATTDFTVGATIITDGVITDAGGLQIAAVLDMANNAINNIGAAGNDFGATTLVMTSANSGAISSISVTNSSNTASSGAQIKVVNAGGSASGDATFYAYETGGDHSFLMGIDTSANINAIANGTALGTSRDVLRFTQADPPVITYNTTHPTGTFDYVCGSCGRHEADDFVCCGRVEWRDDVMDFRAMALRDPEALAYMERVGVIELAVDDLGTPTEFTRLGADFHFAMSAVFQNRVRMDEQYAILLGRIKELEEA